MKDYNKFLEFLDEHKAELEFDTKAMYEKLYDPNVSISQANFNLIFGLQRAQIVCILRQYHAWLNGG